MIRFVVVIALIVLLLFFLIPIILRSGKVTAKAIVDDSPPWQDTKEAAPSVQKVVTAPAEVSVALEEPSKDA